MKKIILGLMGTVIALTATPAMARDHYRNDGYNRGYNQQVYRNDAYRRNAPRYSDRNYNFNRDRRNDDRRFYRNDRCRDRGNGGMLLGAIAGGLLGRSVDTQGDRTAGTVVGALAGGALGRSVDRDCR